MFNCIKARWRSFNHNYGDYAVKCEAGLEYYSNSLSRSLEMNKELLVLLKEKNRYIKQLEAKMATEGVMDILAKARETK